VRYTAFVLAFFLVWLLAIPGYRFQFPRDHFDHPGYRTEWWYYTGNLQAADGHRYGFELVFFRQGERRGPAANPSAWRVDDLYLAHLAWTDIDGRRFHSYRRLNRAGPGIAGASLEQARLWNGNWEAKWDIAAGRQVLMAVADNVRFTLCLTARKPPVLNGENGLSRKAEGEGKASYYVSMTRLEVEGTFNGAAVTGLAWMDHEWFTHQLEENQRGWDWFSVQLDDSTELMLFQLRRMDGSIDPFSAGTFVASDGRATRLNRSDFELTPETWWTSPKTGARYPTAWRVRVPSLRLELGCAAAFEAQELASDDESTPPYWEGAVLYSGTSSGRGYLEMTGYAKPMRLD
jgi:predicted secreted hydrolase